MSAPFCIRLHAHKLDEYFPETKYHLIIPWIAERDQSQYSQAIMMMDKNRYNNRIEWKFASIIVDPEIFIIGNVNNKHELSEEEQIWEETSVLASICIHLRPTTFANNNLGKCMLAERKQKLLPKNNWQRTTDMFCDM